MSTISPTSKRIVVRGACPHDCPDTCATLTEVDTATGRAVKFSADPDHPITQGWLCAKVRPYLDHVYHPDRLQYPLRRVGPKGAASGSASPGTRPSPRSPRAGRRSSPNTAPPRSCPTPTAARSASSRTRSAPSACGTVWAPADCNARSAARRRRRRSRRRLARGCAPDPADILHSKLILLWGHNPASTGPHFMPLLREAQRNGAYVVVIDPRRTHHRALGRPAHRAAPGHRRRAGARPDARPLR